MALKNPSDNTFYVKDENIEQGGNAPFEDILRLVQGDGTFICNESIECRVLDLIT